MNLMDYSLLVGIHDLDLAEIETQEAGATGESDENGYTESEEEAVGGNAGSMDSVPTPPDSPMARSIPPPDFTGIFDDNFERFAIRSCDSE